MSRPPPPINRRRVLIGGAGILGAAVLGVGSGAVPGRDSLQQLIDDLPAGVPHVRPGHTVNGTFLSTAMRGAPTGWTIAYPPDHDGARLRVLIALHGRGANHWDAFGGGLHLDRFLAQAVRRGTPPFAIAAVDGGDHSYWHPRRAGNAAAMVIEEFLPLLGRHGLDISRIGLLGWSMGGYGALYLSTLLGAARVAVAVAESPAIWHRADESAAGAFDDAADFDAHQIFGRTSALAGIPLRIDCGSSDGFAPATRDLRAALSPTPAGGIEPGAHDASFWRSQAAAQLAFVGQHLG
jgi:S-formylglutathione hydrolase FrmB